MKKTIALLVFVYCSLSFIQESKADWISWGTMTGGIGVYYNSTTPEIPSNQAYFKAQYSASSSNGAGFSFTSPLGSPALFNDLGQYGFDLILPAPTILFSVTPPVLTGYDNSMSGAISAGPVAWAINDYKGSSNGPGDSGNGIVNSLIRGTTGSLDVSGVTPIFNDQNVIGYSVFLSGILDSDGSFHWYTIGQPDTLISSWILNDEYLTGRFKFEGTLSYYMANDTTRGMDFYAGTATLYAEKAAVPEPGTLLLLGFGLMGLAGCVRSRK